MAKSAPHDVWLAHLEKLLARRNLTEGQTTLGAEDVREIALEIGLTDEDLRTAEEAAGRCLVRGRGFVERSLWDDAIAELTEAAALAPSSVDVHATLGRAYWGRFAAERTGKDRDTAVRLARLCLELDPKHGPSFDLLATASREAADKPKSMMAAGVTTLALVGLVVAWAWQSSTRAKAQQVSTPAPTELPPSVTLERPPAVSVKSTEPQCAPGMRFETGRDCFRPAIIVEPGRGLGEILIGKSTPEDVLRTFGRDARVSTHASGEVFDISYHYDLDGTFEPSRRANRTRPISFEFKRGRLETIEVSHYQQDLATPGGLHTAAHRADVIREFGEPDLVEVTEKLETLIYRRKGIQVTLSNEDRGVIGFEVFAAGPE